MKPASFLLIFACLFSIAGFSQNTPQTDSTNYGFTFGLHTGARLEFWHQQLYLQDVRFAVYRKQFGFEVGPTLGIANTKQSGNMPYKIRQLADVSGFQFSLNYSWRFSKTADWTFPTGVGMALHYRDYYKPEQSYGGSDPRTEYYNLSQNFNSVELMQGVAWRFAKQWSLRLDAIYAIPFAWGSTYQVVVQRASTGQTPELIEANQAKAPGMFALRAGLGFRLKSRSLGDCNCD